MGSFLNEMPNISHRLAKRIKVILIGNGCETEMRHVEKDFKVHNRTKDKGGLARDEDNKRI